LAVNLDARIVSFDDQQVHLTGKEDAILELLSRRAKRSSRRPAAITTLKRYTTAAICFATQRQRRLLGHTRDDVGGVA